MFWYMFRIYRANGQEGWICLWIGTNVCAYMFKSIHIWFYWFLWWPERLCDNLYCTWTCAGLNALCIHELGICRSPWTCSYCVGAPWQSPSLWKERAPLLGVFRYRGRPPRPFGGRTAFFIPWPLSGGKGIASVVWCRRALQDIAGLGAPCEMPAGTGVKLTGPCEIPRGVLSLDMGVIAICKHRLPIRRPFTPSALYLIMI